MAEKAGLEDKPGERMYFLWELSMFLSSRVCFIANIPTVKKYRRSGIWKRQRTLFLMEVGNKDGLCQVVNR